MLDDLERGKGKLSIRMTDLNAFELGKNVPPRLARSSIRTR
jgi:polyhydroxyalkanoate synthase